MKRQFRNRVPGRTAVVLALFTALSACSVTPPDIEFYCGSPSWTNSGGDSTTYSVQFSTDATAMPWDCSAIVSFDLYDLDGYVHALATYVIEIEATVEEPSFDLEFWSLNTHTFTFDLDTLEESARGSTSYTSRVRGVRTIVPRDVVFQPANTLLYTRWWRLPFETIEFEDMNTGYVARSLAD